MMENMIGRDGEREKKNRERERERERESEREREREREGRKLEKEIKREEYVERPFH